MSTIRAKVVTNSSEDKYARVKVSCKGFWEESDLIESINNIPLKKGDIVYVDITDVCNPLILGRSNTAVSEYSKPIEGSLLFESSDGNNFTIAFVKNDSLVVRTNNAEISLSNDTMILSYSSSKIQISESGIDINNGTLTIDS